MDDYQEYLSLKERFEKKGHWIKQKLDDHDMHTFLSFYKFVCSECDDWTTYGMTKYCPNCGARMEGVSE